MASKTPTVGNGLSCATPKQMQIAFISTISHQTAAEWIGKGEALYN